MNKNTLVKNIAKRLEKHNIEMHKIVNEVLGEIVEELKKGNKVNLSGFGTFEVRKRASRVGRDPQTGDQIQLPETITAGFSASKKLRQIIANNNPQ